MYDAVLPFKGSGVHGGEPCGEMERALAARAGSMSLSPKSWVTLVFPSLSKSMISPPLPSLKVQTPLKQKQD